MMVICLPCRVHGKVHFHHLRCFCCPNLNWGCNLESKVYYCCVQKFLWVCFHWFCRQNGGGWYYPKKNYGDLRNYYYYYGKPLPARFCCYSIPHCCSGCYKFPGLFSWVHKFRQAVHYRAWEKLNRDNNALHKKDNTDCKRNKDYKIHYTNLPIQSPFPYPYRSLNKVNRMSMGYSRSPFRTCYQSDGFLTFIRR